MSCKGTVRVKDRVFSKWIVVLEMFLSAGLQLGGHHLMRPLNPDDKPTTPVEIYSQRHCQVLTH
jgi:hypothetical protein